MLNTVIKLLFICLVAISLAGHSEQTIRLTNGEWRPFMSEHADHFGIGSHLVTQAFALKNVKVEYGFFPWKRAYNYAKAGVWDGSLLWSRNDERQQSFYFSDPVLVTSEVFFHIVGKKVDWNSLSQLSHLKIGATSGYYYGEDFKLAEEQGAIRVERVDTDLLNLKKLIHGRIDLFVINEHVGYDLINRNFSSGQREQFTHNQQPVRRDKWYLILSKEYPRSKEMIKTFNQGLQMLKESGEYDRIFNAL